MLMINESQPSGLNVSSYTVEEVETITSEYIMKNAVSMLTQACSMYVKCFLELACLLLTRLEFLARPKSEEADLPSSVCSVETSGLHVDFANSSSIKAFFF